MLPKRIIHVEVDGRTYANTEGLKEGLEGLAIKAADSCDFEDILSNAIQSLYRAQPEGQANYSEENPRIGKVWLCRFNNEKGEGNADIEYTPSDYYEEKWRYIQSTIGTVSLRDRTYSTRWDREDKRFDENYWQTPEALMKDTETVMELLGLKYKDRKYG